MIDKLKYQRAHLDALYYADKMQINRKFALEHLKDLDPADQHVIAIESMLESIGRNIINLRTALCDIDQAINNQ